MKVSKNTNRNNRSLGLNTNININRKTNCYFHECNTNTYAHVFNKPPVFRLKPPPNPLNFNLNPESLFFSSKANLIKTSNENEQFLLYYLNLNESLTTTNQHIHNSHFHNHQSVNYYAEKCTNLRLYQIASASTYSQTNNFGFKHLKNEFFSKNETLHFLPTKAIASTITTTVQSQMVRDGLNGGEIATNSITNVKNSNESNGLVLFSSMSLIAISVLFLLFYLYYHYFYSSKKHSHTSSSSSSGIDTLSSTSTSSKKGKDLHSDTCKFNLINTSNDINKSGQSNTININNNKTNSLRSKEPSFRQPPPPQPQQTHLNYNESETLLLNDYQLGQTDPNQHYYLTINKAHQQFNKANTNLSHVIPVIPSNIILNNNQTYHQFHQKQIPHTYLTMMSPPIPPTIINTGSSSATRRKKLKKFTFKNTKKLSKELLKPFIDTSTTNTTTTTTGSSNSDNQIYNSSNHQQQQQHQHHHMPCSPLLNYSTLSKQVFQNVPCNYFHQFNGNMHPQNYYHTNFHKVALVYNNPSSSTITDPNHSPQLIRIVNLNQVDLNNCLNCVPPPLTNNSQHLNINPNDPLLNHYENHNHNYQKLMDENVNKTIATNGDENDKMGKDDFDEQIYELIDENTSFNLNVRYGEENGMSSSIRRNFPKTNPNFVKTFKPVVLK